MTESKAIKDSFVRLRKFGHIVFNFNSSRANNPGIKGFPDWLIITRNYNLVFIEVKIGKDKLKIEQEVVIRKLANMMGIPGSRVNVFICKDKKMADNISDQILKGEL